MHLKNHVVNKKENLNHSILPAFMFNLFKMGLLKEKMLRHTGKRIAKKKRRREKRKKLIKNENT